MFYSVGHCTERLLEQVGSISDREKTKQMLRIKQLLMPELTRSCSRTVVKDTHSLTL